MDSKEVKQLGFRRNRQRPEITVKFQEAQTNILWIQFTNRWRHARERRCWHKVKRRTMEKMVSGYTRWLRIKCPTIQNAISLQSIEIFLNKNFKFYRENFSNNPWKFNWKIFIASVLVWWNFQWLLENFSPVKLEILVEINLHRLSINCILSGGEFCFELRCRRMDKPMQIGAAAGLVG